MNYDSQTEAEKINEKFFSLIKDLTVLTGTIFGSSIALSVGREVNLRFIIGEVLLFISLSAGITNLYAEIKASEGIHFHFTSSNLKSNLNPRTGGIEDFIVDEQEKLIKAYDDLYKKNQNDPLKYILKIIKIDYFYPIVLISLLFGVVFILLSLVDLSNFSFS